MQPSRSGPQSLPRKVRGLAAVELALVLPIFLLLMLATAEFGRALYQFNVLTKSIRDGAQYIARNCLSAGEVNLTDNAAAVTTAKNLIVYGKPTAGTAGTELLKGMTTNDCANATQDCISVVGAAPMGGPNTYVTVTAMYKFRPIFGAIPAFPVGRTIAEPGVMTATITMAGLGS